MRVDSFHLVFERHGSFQERRRAGRKEGRKERRIDHKLTVVFEKQSSAFFRKETAERAGPSRPGGEGRSQFAPSLWFRFLCCCVSLFCVHVTE